MAIFEDVFHRNANCVPNVLYVIFIFIGVTKLWDMLIDLGMCNGHIAGTKGPDSKSSWQMINEHIDWVFVEYVITWLWVRAGGYYTGYVSS